MHILKYIVIGLFFISPAWLNAQHVGLNLHYVGVEKSSFGDGAGIGVIGDIPVMERISIQPSLNFTAYKRDVVYITPAVGRVIYYKIHVNPGLSVLYYFKDRESKIRPYAGLGASYLSIKQVHVLEGRIGPDAFSRFIISAPVGVLINQLGNSNFGMSFSVVPSRMLRLPSQVMVNPGHDYNLNMIQFKVGGHLTLGKNKSP